MEDNDYLRHDLDNASHEIVKLQSDVTHLERTVQNLEQQLLLINTRIERLERRKPEYDDGIVLD